MSITIDLPPEIEQSLSILAKERGIPLPIYLGQLLAERIIPSEPNFSPAQRAQMWRDSAKGLPDSAPLSDAAISRESIYADRG